MALLVQPPLESGTFRRLVRPFDVPIGEAMMDEDRIIGTAHELQGDAKEAAGRVTGDPKVEAEGWADQARGAAERGMGRAREGVREAGDTVKQGAESLGDFIDATVRERPLTALLAAGAVGYVLGTLIHRR